MKHHITSTFTACALALLCVPGMAKQAAAKASTKELAKADEVVEVDRADPAIQAAVKKARASFDQFISVVSVKSPKIGDIAVRIELHERKRSEYVWLTPFTILSKNSYKGTINSMPTIVRTFKVGQEVPFKRDDVVDWMYTDAENHIMHGNFTTCAQLAKAPEADIKEMKKRYGLDCSR